MSITTEDSEPIRRSTDGRQQSTGQPDVELGGLIQRLNRIPLEAFSIILKYIFLDEHGTDSIETYERMNEQGAVSEIVKRHAGNLLLNHQLVKRLKSFEYLDCNKDLKGTVLLNMIPRTAIIMETKARGAPKALNDFLNWLQQTVREFPMLHIKSIWHEVGTSKNPHKQRRLSDRGFKMQSIHRFEWFLATLETVQKLYAANAKITKEIESEKPQRYFRLSIHFAVFTRSSRVLLPVFRHLYNDDVIMCSFSQELVEEELYDFKKRLTLATVHGLKKVERESLQEIRKDKRDQRARCLN